jgi:hypothetical protein
VSAVRMQSFVTPGPGQRAVVYRVLLNGQVVWQRTLPVLGGRHSNMPARALAAQEQEQVCRVLLDTGQVPTEFENERPTC